MKKIHFTLGGLLSIFLLCGFTPQPQKKTFQNEQISVLSLGGDVLCVENRGYSRHSFILWFKNEAVSRISVGGGQTSCFEIGTYEQPWQWKVSKGDRGLKKNFYSGTAVFY